MVASAAGIDPNYYSTTATPTYQAGGTITGSKGQTCNLTDFSVGGGTGINPTYDQGTKTPTYISGGSIVGTQGETCNLGGFNGVTNATGIVTLNDTNTIATGTQLTITSPGFGGGSTPPTTATLSNGTATCSGTATVITQLLTTVGLSSGECGGNGDPHRQQHHQHRNAAYHHQSGIWRDPGPDYGYAQ